MQLAGSRAGTSDTLIIMDECNKLVLPVIYCIHVLAISVNVHCVNLGLLIHTWNICMYLL